MSLTRRRFFTLAVGAGAATACAPIPREEENYDRSRSEGGGGLPDVPRAIDTRPLWDQFSDAERACREATGYNHPNRSCIRNEQRKGQRIVDGIRILRGGIGILTGPR